MFVKLYNYIISILDTCSSLVQVLLTIMYISITFRISAIARMGLYDTFFHKYRRNKENVEYPEKGKMV